MKRMIALDGAQGEGGGQILRSALSLSMITGQPFTITGIRAGRAKPGLLRQHLTAVKAAKEICRATVEGAELGSQRLIFRPGTVRGGDYRFAIGSAGSSTLVLQTVLPALWFADGPSRVEVSGGTDNPSAPPADFIRRVLEPLLAKIGVHQQTTLLRHGFILPEAAWWQRKSHRWHRLIACNLASAGTLCRCVERCYWLVCRAMLLSVKSLHWRVVFPCMRRIFITCRVTRAG